MEEYSCLLNRISSSLKEYEDNDNLIFEINDKIAQEKIRNIFSRVKKLILVKLDAIGDSILFTNSFKEIRNLFPNAAIAVLVFLETKDITDRNPYVDSILYIDRESIYSNKAYWERFIKSISKFEFDLLINPLYSRDYFTDELVRFINAKYKIGVSGDRSNIIEEVFCATNNNYDYLLKVKSDKMRFELHRNAEIISLLGGNSDPGKLPELWLSKKDELIPQKFLNEYKIQSYAIVFPAGKGGKTSPKYWGSENLASLIDYLQLKLNITVLLIAGPGDSNICVEISALAKSKPIILQGHFNIWEVAQLILRSRFFIGADTSIAHLSAALKKETFVLVGGGHFGRFFPYPTTADNVHAFYKELSCFHCNWICTKGSNDCLKNITVKEIISYLKKNGPVRDDNKKSTINVLRSKGSNPRIDLIVPPGEIHSWHLKEGFEYNLKGRGLLNRVFYSDENSYYHILKYLSSGGDSDFILAPGGDHHLHYLHDTDEKKDIWKMYRNPKVCYSYESTNNSIYPVYIKRARNAKDVFTHILAADESDIGFWKSNNMNAIWFPQFVDEKLFCSLKPLNERKNKIIFRGKLWFEYEERKKIINELQVNSLCDVNPGRLPTSDLINLYNEYVFNINPPGVFGGFNVRTFETMACENILLQYEHKNRPRNNALFRDKKHLIYFTLDNYSNTLKEFEYYLKHSTDFYSVAAAGKEEVLNHHTINARIDSMMKWLDTGKIPEYPDYSNQKSCLTQSSENAETLKKSQTIPYVSCSSRIRVSAIVSTYNSEKFIFGCLDDLINQTLFKKGELEIVIVNSGSQQKEEEIIKDFQKKFKNIVYIKTPSTETIYKAWNRCIKAASGKYITNANTDDRHKNDALEILADELDNNPETALVYADCKITNKENESFNSAVQTGYFLWPEFDKEKLFSICYIGPQPMWRKSLHDKYGLFDEKYQAAGDYEFWLRIASKEKFKHVSKIIGLYLQSGNSIEHRLQQTSLKESIEARKRHWKNTKPIPPPSGSYLIQYAKSEKLNNSPLFSVVIPTFNRPASLRKALKSLSGQTFKNFEVIVINDGTESVLDILKEFGKVLSIQFLQHTANMERSAARNNGIKISLGKYITFLDDDDIYYPNHLEVMSKNISDSYGVLYTDAMRAVYKNINGEEKIVNKYVPYSIDYSRDKLLIGNIAPINCFAVKKAVFNESGLFNEELRVLEDWELLLRISLHTNFLHIPEVTSEVSWPLDGSSTTLSSGNEFSRIREKIYKKYEAEIKQIKNPDAIINEFNRIWEKDRLEEYPLVSIITLTYNQLEFTKQFIDSIINYTNCKYELIIVDNGSENDTLEYLHNLSESDKNVKVVYNKENYGFPKGINQGLNISSAPYVLIANNDIIVTEDWLNRMIQIAESDDSVGIVGTMSNMVSGVQLDKSAKYDTIKEMHKYAGSVKSQFKNEQFIFPRVAFLCTLIKRKLIDKIGGLDERFSPGNFEDDDFCLRAQLAGYKTVIAKDVFIHHFGSKSFKNDGNDKYIKLLETNKQIFIEKWGADPEQIWLKGVKPKSRSIVYPLNSDKLMELIRNATEEIEKKNYASAYSDIQVVIENYYKADKTENIIGYSTLLNLAGNVALFRNDYSAAKTYFEEALKSDPDSSTACAGLAELFYLEKNYSAAKVMFEFAIRNDSNNIFAVERLKTVNLNLGYEETHNSLLISNQVSVT